MSEKRKVRRVAKEKTPVVESPKSTKTTTTTASPTQHKVAPDSGKATDSAVSSAEKVGRPTGNIPTNLNIAYGRGMPWSSVTVDAPHHEKYGNPYDIAAMLMAMEVIESGGKMIWNTGGSGAYGIMQIKESSWGWLARQIGANLQTREGQIATAAAILGYAGKGANPRERFLYSYYPVLDKNGNICLDCKGEDGGTPRQYLQDMDTLIGIINAAVPEETKPATPSDVLNMIIGGARQYAPLFEFGGLNFDANGKPLNYYSFGVGHGTSAANAHSGTDIFVSDNTPIYTPLDGTVRCVGRTGNPDWGQSCGAYEDENGGIGNVTIMTNVGLKLTFGHMSTSSVKVGDKVKAGQQIGTSGSFNAPHLHYEVSINAPERVSKTGNYPDLPYFLLNPLPATAEKMSAVPTTRPIKPPQPKMYDLKNNADAARFGLNPGQRDTILSKKYINRNGKRPEVIVLHVQDGYTSGSLKHWLGVSASSTIMVQQDDSILNVIPRKDGPWTNGDTKSPSARAKKWMSLLGNDLNPFSLTCEAEDGGSRKIDDGQKQSIIWWIMDCWDQWPHMAGDMSRILGHYEINAVDRPYCGLYTPDIIAALNTGGTIDPDVTYPKAVPPPEWDGRDKVVNNVTFFALRRMYVANRDGVKAHQYADPMSKEVRAPLKKGEEFEGVYVANGADNNLWIVTPFGSRIVMDDAEPMFEFAV